MKWNLRLFSIIFAALILASCSDAEPEMPDTPDKPDVPSQSVRRTVLVYMVANNNLTGYSYRDLDEMLKAQPSKDARWLIYHAPSSAPARLLELCDGDTITLKDYETTSSVTFSRMTEVLDDMARMAPAQKYGLVLWSHGSGWLVNGIQEDLPDEPYLTKPLSFGRENTESMDISTLRKAIKGRNIDYAYFDACYMSAIEVAYEMRDAVDYIIGSASELPSDGMRYDFNVAPLCDGSEDSLIEAAQNTYNEYNSMFYKVDRTCTMSVIRTSALERLAVATAKIYALTPLAHPGAEKTNYSVYGLSVNAYDFGEYVNALALNEALDQALVDEFNDALDEAVIYKNATEYLWGTRRIYSTSGLSTYIFNDEEEYMSNKYNTTQWAIDVASHHLHE